VSRVSGEGVDAPILPTRNEAEMDRTAKKQRGQERNGEDITHVNRRMLLIVEQ